MAGFSWYKPGAVIAAWVVCVVAAYTAFGQAPLTSANLDVDGARIQNADSEPENWLAHGRTYSEQRYSPLVSIYAGNVDELGLAWATPTGVNRGHEASPIVVDGAMFLTLPWSKVMALNAQTGAVLWEYDPLVPRAWGRYACCDVVNRGVALWKGNVYVGTIDGRLVALNARTGEPVWVVQTTDRDRPYTITGAPRVVKDKVIIGNGGAELGVRGYITAYDAATGEQQWRFYTVPGNPDEPFEHPEMEMAAETWNGTWWEVGGGGTAWDSMAYDPELNLLYVGTGNGSPWNREIRSPGGGDNLFLSSILAINPDSGRLVWHYQTTPADNWDYTATQHLILAELEIDGELRDVIMQAPKNGFFYVLDRATGELLSAENYVDVTWASHVDMETGRPVETGVGDYADAPKLVKPSPFGGHNWHPMAYNPRTKLVYIPAIAAPFLYVHEKDFEYRNGTWNTGVDFAAMITLLKGVSQPELLGYLRAWDPVKQEEVWSVRQTTVTNGGLLTTAGNLVFQGTGDGRFLAYAADTGKKLWEAETNIGTIAPPVTYTVDGEQFIAVVAGWGGVPPIVGADAGVSATATHANESFVLAFKLGGDTPMPNIAEKRFTAIPPQPEDEAARDVVLLGEKLFHQHCSQCHGNMAVTSGVISDLRMSSSAVHRAFSRIVLNGVMEESGMAGYDDVLDDEQVEAIQSYIIDRARKDRAKQLRSSE